MGAIGGDGPVHWDKVDGAETANGCGGGPGKLEKILVSVRLRPLSDKEIARGDPAEWECINDTTIISRSAYPDRPTAPTAYSFDRVFHADCNTKEVYEDGAKAVALSVHEERAFILKFSAIEIYNEVVRDLLSSENTSLRLWDDAEKGTYVENLTETIESSAHEFLGKDKSTTLVACVNFVDLAGSERASQALSAGTRLKEASYSNLEALVKEKDSQIRKMEKEIKELKLQRDLAQSRLQDLLQVVGDNHASKRPMASARNFSFDVPQPYEDELSTTESSEVVNSGQSVRFQGRGAIQRGHRQNSENNLEFPTPSSYSVSSPPFSGMPPTNSREDASQISNEDSEDLCKEVRCIEVNETKGNECLDTSAVGSNSIQDSNVGSIVHANNVPNLSVNSRQHDVSPITLEQHLENVRKPFANLVKDLGSSTRNSSSSKVIGRSRSCRSLMGSTLFEDLEKDDCTPPSRRFMDFPGRPERCQRALNYDAESETLSRAGSMLSEITTTRDGGVKANGSVAGDTEYTGIGEFVTELKEMAQVQYQKQRGDQGENGDLTEGTIKSVGLDPIMDALQSPSRWPLEFEKKQQEIIDLWHACNVSLVHRTYFFLLFKGDPADAIYMEVELRRLSFLKDIYSNGRMGSNVVAGRPNTSLISSAKKLQREREMLCRQMQKRLTIQERESMYTKWGVALTSKRRRLQVARRLWTETKDLEHVRESASLVARLIGLLEPGKALREMFGLSFAPQQFTRRSHNSWKYGRSILD
ncbi:hypothetical protein PR202_ga19537 [Eleusine coracana subsp. coracana]|uniref:Kinesin motor domain-containing protein n=1 Tax=Eleusine coracana subsp. coracana TaxID=191504 RepID=A0AAV5CVV2_ELECO|nr:hypothetical protein PR202_ga19537 [Eleusine coracana subsp. coracana]